MDCEFSSNETKCGRHQNGTDVGTGELDANRLTRKRFAESCGSRVDERWVNGRATESEQANTGGLQVQRERNRKDEATHRDDGDSSVNQAMVGKLDCKKSACNAANHHGCKHERNDECSDFGFESASDEVGAAPKTSRNFECRIKEEREERKLHSWDAERLANADVRRVAVGGRGCSRRVSWARDFHIFRTRRDGDVFRKSPAGFRFFPQRE